MTSLTYLAMTTVFLGSPDLAGHEPSATTTSRSRGPERTNTSAVAKQPGGCCAAACDVAGGSLRFVSESNPANGPASESSTATAAGNGPGTGRLTPIGTGLCENSGIRIERNPLTAKATQARDQH